MHGWLVPVLNLLGMGGSPGTPAPVVPPGFPVALTGSDSSRVTLQGSAR